MFTKSYSLKTLGHDVYAPPCAYIKLLPELGGFRMTRIIILIITTNNISPEWIHV